MQNILRREDLGIFQKLKEKQVDWKVVRERKCGMGGG